MAWRCDLLARSLVKLKSRTNDGLTALNRHAMLTTPAPRISSPMPRHPNALNTSADVADPVYREPQTNAEWHSLPSPWS